MRIGIFGGCFNPPHKMHKNIALELLNNDYLDKIIYVPVSDKYNKNGLIDFKYRFAMVKMMIEDNDKLLVSDVEDSKDKQYTYQVLDYFQSLNSKDNIYFICGSDNLNEFDTWKHYKEILRNYKLLVIKRNNDDIENILNKYLDYINSIVIADIETSDLSSTYVRINMENDIIKENVDSKVYDYIKKNDLYKK